MDFTHLQTGEQLSSWIAAGLIAIAFILVQRLRTPNISNFPLCGKEYGSRRKRAEAFVHTPIDVYRKAYETFKDQIYRITTPDNDHLIVPAQYLDELRQKSDDEIDVLTSFEDMLANDHIKLFPPKDRTEVANSVVKVELTRNLVRLNPRLSAEVEETISQELPAAEDWTAIPAFASLCRVVAIVSGNIFVGPDLCRHEAYLDSAINFTADTTAATHQVKAWPRWFRSSAVALGLCPAIQKARAHRQRMSKFLGPLVTERRQLLKEGKPVPDDMFQWIIEKAQKNGITELEHLASMQLLLTFAAIHTTSLTATAMMYDLATRPEIVEDLRKEIKSVLSETDGVMTSTALFNMKLLDSVMRESQRFTPPFTDSFRRYTKKLLVLKDGTRIPAGVFIDTASHAVLHDPKHYKDPDTFDAYRFYNLRTQEDYPDPNGFKNREQYQFVSVTKENTSFGYGKHACPGRFFAANEIKLIMAQLLLQFDLRFPPDVKERYPNFYAGSLAGPNFSGLVELRRIRK